MAANRTPNLGLNIWYENEAVNFEEVNENFENLDDMVMCIEHGTITSEYTGGSETAAKWRYKKYSDGTVEFISKLAYTNLKCNNGSSAPYYSASSTVRFPFSLKEVYDVQMHLASNTYGWPVDMTTESVKDKIEFRVMALSSETTEIYKQVFVSVKGVLA